MKIFILGSNDRAAIACIHSLKDTGIPIHVIYGDSECPSLKSKYLASTHFISQKQKITKTLEKFYEIIPKDAFLLPINDYYLEFCIKFYEELDSYYQLSFATKKATQRIINKKDLLHVANKLNISTPKSIIIKNNKDIDCLDKKNINFPVIAKPTKSAVIVNEYILSTSVKKISSFDELILELKLNIHNSEYIIQEYIPGSGKALNFFSVNGDIKSAFQYIRINEPGFGGGSSLRKSIPLSNKFLERSKELIKEFDYTGIGMIEFRTSFDDKKDYLMEVNARPWGSISLPIFAGINFPQLLLHKQLDKKINFLEYKSDVYARNILKDINWNLKYGLKEKGLKVFLEPIKAIFNHQRKIEVFDTLTANDNRPFFKALKNFFSQNFEKVFEKLISKILLLHSYLNIRKTSKKISMIAKKKKICFVCRGNIIRSKYAQKFYENISGSVASSCGTHFSENRNSPPEAIKESAKRNIILDSPVSKTIYSIEEPNKYLFLVMDEKNLFDLKYKFKINDVFLLSNAGGGKGIIPDPYHKATDSSQYKDSFNKIEEYLKKMVKENI